MNNRIAKLFARIAHGIIGQKRKYSGARYTVHTEAVNKTVMKHGGTSAQGQASHLHDYSEDVVTKLEAEGRLITLAILQFLYRHLFSHYVRHLAFELTDQFSSEKMPNVNRKTRKTMEAERIAKISDDAKTIKLADLLDNSESIVKDDPDFAITYLKEKAAMMKGLRGGNPALYALVEKQLQEAVIKLDVRLD